MKTKSISKKPENVHKKYDASIHNDNYKEEISLKGTCWSQQVGNQLDYPSVNEYNILAILTECKLITFFSAKSLNKVFFDEVFNFNLQLPTILEPY